MPMIKTLSQRLQDMNDDAVQPRDFDPEDIDKIESEASDSDNDSAAFNARDDVKDTEHYVPMGTSKLRRPTSPELGSQYTGAQVSRKALLDDDDGDEDHFGQDDVSDSGISGGDADSVEEEDVQGFDKQEFTDEDEDSEEKDSPASKSASLKRMMGLDNGIHDESINSNDDAPESRTSELKSLMNPKAAAQSISIAQVADKEKGLAVKQQRKTFDTLLNVRIRLQKTLVATNSMTAIDDMDITSVEPYEAAEEAAIKLFNQLSAMRHTLDSVDAVKTGSKRKRDIDMATRNEAIWKKLQVSEQAAKEKRQATLEFWSKKVKGAQVATTTGQVKGTSATLSITQVLEDQLSNSAHLIKRTRTPRSCAPLQVKAKIPEDENIYDDADFYQLLLKELVDQRMVESVTNTPAVTGINDAVTSWTAVKEAKTRKNVDTKASKGRKMKFTVHEKLQNFMAPDDRTSWEQDACDRFFGSLFGQRLNLDNGDEDVEVNEPLPDEGLMVFRS